MRLLQRSNTLLQTDLSPELQEEVNRWLVRIYIDDKRFDEAGRISTAMRESSPENILDLIEAGSDFKGNWKTRRSTLSSQGSLQLCPK